MFDIAVTCLVLTALLAYLNHRLICLPPTIGVMGIALLLSFALIGLEVILIEFSTSLALALVVVIATTLGARLLSVGAPVVVLGRLFRLPQGALRVLTWGGLRGGISVALALSLPLGPSRDLVLALTYAVVVFSILVQGLTIGKVVRTQCA